jgi:hypothetical protein
MFIKMHGETTIKIYVVHLTADINCRGLRASDEKPYKMTFFLLDLGEFGRNKSL